MDRFPPGPSFAVAPRRSARRRRPNVRVAVGAHSGHRRAVEARRDARDGEIAREERSPFEGPERLRGAPSSFSVVLGGWPFPPRAPPLLAAVPVGGSAIQRRERHDGETQGRRRRKRFFARGSARVARESARDEDRGAARRQGDVARAEPRGRIVARERGEARTRDETRLGGGFVVVRGGEAPQERVRRGVGDFASAFRGAAAFDFARGEDDKRRAAARRARALRGRDAAHDAVREPRAKRAREPVRVERRGWRSGGGARLVRGGGARRVRDGRRGVLAARFPDVPPRVPSPRRFAGRSFRLLLREALRRLPLRGVVEAVRAAELRAPEGAVGRGGGPAPAESGRAPDETGGAFEAAARRPPEGSRRAALRRRARRAARGRGRSARATLRRRVPGSRGGGRGGFRGRRGGVFVVVVAGVVETRLLRETERHARARDARGTGRRRARRAAALHPGGARGGLTIVRVVARAPAPGERLLPGRAREGPGVADLAMQPRRTAGARRGHRRERVAKRSGVARRREVQTVAQSLEVRGPTRRRRERRSRRHRDERAEL